MAIQTVREAIADLNQHYGKDLDQQIIITWWDKSDFSEYEDIDQAYADAEDQLDSCIGHVNEYVEDQNAVI